LSFQLGLQAFDGLLQVGAIADRRRGRRGAPGGPPQRPRPARRAPSPAADGFHDGRPEQARHFGEVKLEAAGLGDVAHVEGEHHGHAQLHELHRQIQLRSRFDASITVTTTSGFSSMMKFRATRLPANRPSAVGARQIHDVEFRVAAQAGAFLLFDRHAGIVADVLAARRSIG
jgi:hypothetical protein